MCHGSGAPCSEDILTFLLFACRHQEFWRLKLSSCPGDAGRYTPGKKPLGPFRAPPPLVHRRTSRGKDSHTLNHLRRTDLLETGADQGSGFWEKQRFWRPDLSLFSLRTLPVKFSYRNTSILLFICFTGKHSDSPPDKSASARRFA